MASSCACHSAKNAIGSRSKASRRLIIVTRSCILLGVFTSTAKPNRSKSWGRNSPSSGLPLPTKTNLAGWRILKPSRSTTFSPEAATSISKSTKWSSSKFTSSIYRKPRLARANKPGSNAFSPRVNAFSRSKAPTTRSSVAPKGKSTTGTGRLIIFSLIGLVFFPIVATLAFKVCRSLPRPSQKKQSPLGVKGSQP